MRRCDLWMLMGLMGMACVPDLRDRLTRDDGDGAGEEDLAPEGELDTGADLSIPQEVVIDATSETDWWLYDFERQGLVDESLPWDLRFQRYRVELNGGINGDGDVYAVVLDGILFDDVTADDVPPSADAAWITDAEDADGDGDADTVFVDWFDYDPTTHILTPKPRTTLIRTVEGMVVKVEIVDYYDGTGTSGYPRFRWAELIE